MGEGRSTSKMYVRLDDECEQERPDDGARSKFIDEVVDKIRSRKAIHLVPNGTVEAAMKRAEV